MPSVLLWATIRKAKTTVVTDKKVVVRIGLAPFLGLRCRKLRWNESCSLGLDSKKSDFFIARRISAAEIAVLKDNTQPVNQVIALTAKSPFKARQQEQEG